jgi:hypothetical protein
VKGAVSLRDLYETYSDRIQFLMIYIREAHPTDGWYMGRHDIRSHRTLEERRKVASECELTLRYGIPTLVDEMDDAVMTAYAGHPDRLHLVGRDGRMAYVGGRGPFGFKPTELRDAIERELAKPRAGGHVRTEARAPR